MDDIKSLASIIYENTNKYSELLAANGQPQPSHDAPSTGSQPPPKSNPEVMRALTAAIEATHELNRLLIGPVGQIMSLGMDLSRPMVLNFIHRNQIPAKIPLDGKISYKELAEACNLDEEDTTRILRVAVADHMFKEVEKGYIAHSAASQVLASNLLLNSWVGMMMQEHWPAAFKITDAVSKWPGSQEATGKTAYALAHDIQGDPFKAWEQDPPRAKQFSDAMAWQQSYAPFNPAGLAASFDFGALGKAKFVDVGGSRGHVSIAIARSFPDLSCIVQDLEGTIAAAKCPEDLKERLQFMPHDFFQEQPVKDADIYFFRFVFHDWSDEYCVKILRQLIPGLRNGTKILVNDICLPPPGVLSMVKERRFRTIDMAMKIFSNGKERSAEDWNKLFAQADSRFFLVKIHQPPPPQPALIEVEWRA